MKTTNDTLTWNNPSARATRLIAEYSYLQGLRNSYATIATLQHNTYGQPGMADSLGAARIHIAKQIESKQAEIDKLWSENAGNQEVFKLVEAAELASRDYYVR